MSKKRPKKRDLKQQLEELECEIALFKMRGKKRIVEKLQSKYANLRLKFIEENIKYYEPNTST